MIKVTARNLKEVKDFFKDLPRGTRIVAMRAFITYVIGNEQRGLKHEPPQKVVTRAKAYGKVSDAPAGYFSWKQFRFVAAITDGFTRIPWTRKHEIAPAWKMTEQDSQWRSVKATNDQPGAQWIYDDQKQARQPALVGWRKVKQIMIDNAVGALKAAEEAVQRWIKEHEKK